MGNDLKKQLQKSTDEVHSLRDQLTSEMDAREDLTAELKLAHSKIHGSSSTTATDLNFESLDGVESFVNTPRPLSASEVNVFAKLGVSPVRGNLCRAALGPSSACIDGTTQWNS